MLQGQELTLLILTVTVSFTSLICSGINILLINSLGKENYFLRILWNMCVCQICYDVTFYFHQCIYINKSISAAAELSNLFGGLSVSFWTNMLTYVMYQIVFRKQAVEFVENFRMHFMIVIGTSLCIGIAGMISYIIQDKLALYIIDVVYYILRLISIAINIIGFYAIYYRVEQMVTNGKSHIDISIIVLARRLMYYPLVQFLTRIVTAVYEAEYGFAPYSGHSSTNRFIMQCCICILQPSGGIGFLIVFLLFQPKAFEQLVLWCRACRSCSSSSYSNNKSTSKLNSMDLFSSNNLHNNNQIDNTVSTSNPLYNSNNNTSGSSNSNNNNNNNNRAPLSDVTNIQSGGTNSLVLTSSFTSFQLSENAVSDRDTLTYLLNKYSELDDHDLCSIVRNSSNTNAPQYYHNSRLESVD